MVNVLRRIVVKIGNGRIYINSEEDFEVLFSDREGTYIQWVKGTPEEVKNEFDRYKSEREKAAW